MFLQKDWEWEKYFTQPQINSIQVLRCVFSWVCTKVSAERLNKCLLSCINRVLCLCHLKDTLRPGQLPGCVFAGLVTYDVWKKCSFQLLIMSHRKVEFLDLDISNNWNLKAFLCCEIRWVGCTAVAWLSQSPHLETSSNILTCFFPLPVPLIPPPPSLWNHYTHTQSPQTECERLTGQNDES